MQVRRVPRKTKETTDAWTRYEDTLQIGEVNGRAALVAGLEQRHIWVCERDGYLTVRSCRTGAVLSKITKEGVFPWCLAEGPLKRNVWVGYSSGNIILYSASAPYNQKLVLEAGPMTGGCHCLLSHLHYVFAGYGNCQVVKWNNDTKEREGYYIGHTSGSGSAIRAVELHLTTLYTCADDKTIRGWDINTCEQIQAFKGHEASVLALAYSRNNHLWSTGEDGTVRVWDPDTTSCLRVFKLDSPAGVLSFLGNRVWCGSWNRKITLFDVVSCEKVATLKSHTAPVADIISVATTRIFKIWSLGTDKCLKVWRMEMRDEAYEDDFKKMQQTIFDLQTRVDQLERQLGIGDSRRRERIASISSLSDIDGSAYCSSQLARRMRTEIEQLKCDHDALRNSTAARQILLADICAQRGARETRVALIRRYFQRLSTFWHAKNRARRPRRKRPVNRTRESFLSTRSAFGFLCSLEKIRDRSILESVFAAWRKRGENAYKWKRLSKKVPHLTKAGHVLLRATAIGLLRSTYDRWKGFRCLRMLERSASVVRDAMARQMPREVLRKAFKKLRLYCWMRPNRQDRLQGTVSLAMRQTTHSLRQIYFKKLLHYFLGARRSGRNLDGMRHRMQRALTPEQSEKRRSWRLRAACNLRSITLTALCKYSFNKLLSYALLHRNRALQELVARKSRQFGTVSEEHDELLKTVNDLHQAMRSSNEAAVDQKVNARRWEQKCEEARDINQVLLDKVEKMQAEVRGLKEKLRKTRALVPHRNQLLQAGREVFRLILQAETHTNQFLQCLDRQSMNKRQLDQHTLRIRDAILEVRSCQRTCLEKYFTDDEKLSGNVAATLFGKAVRDQCVMKCQETSPTPGVSSTISLPTTPGSLNSSLFTPPNVNLASPSPSKHSRFVLYSVQRMRKGNGAAADNLVDHIVSTARTS